MWEVEIIFDFRNVNHKTITSNNVDENKQYDRERERERERTQNQYIFIICLNNFLSLNVIF